MTVSVSRERGENGRKSVLCDGHVEEGSASDFAVGG
jgi:hypothetical protein